MFKVIEGGASDSQQANAISQAGEFTTTLALPKHRPTTAAVLQRAISSMDMETDLLSAIETYHTLQDFALKACEFITPFYPPTSAQYPCLLAEVLDRAYIGYMRTIGRSPREQMAHFLADGVKAASLGVLTYRVRQQRGEEVKEWLPWEHGALADWVQWGGADLEFTKAYNQATEVTHVTSYVVQRELLSYPAVLTVVRAGIDLQGL